MDELFNQHRAIHIPDEQITDVVTESNAVGYNKLLSGIGYTLTAESMDVVNRVSENMVLYLRDKARALNGPSYSNNTLFSKFPFETPDQNDYLSKRILSMFQGYPARSNKITPLSCGHVINDSLFDMSEFNACPICQNRVPELSGQSRKELDYVALTPLKPIRMINDAELSNIVRSIIIRNGSISASEKMLLDQYAKDADWIEAAKRPLFKETLPLVYKNLSDPSILNDQISGATDLLRIATYLSNSEGDLSLASNTRFDLTTSQKKKFLRMFEETINANAEEDLLRHREKWLRLAEVLAVGSKKNAKKYPLTALAFDTLRNRPKTIVTYNRVAERITRDRSPLTDIDIRILASRPTSLGRRIDALLRNNTDTTNIKKAFSDSTHKMPMKYLHELMKTLGNMPSNPTVREDRAFYIKGKSNRMKVVPDTRKYLNENHASDVIELWDVVRSEIVSRHKTKESLGKVYIDPLLTNIILPFNKRGDSSSDAPVSKGSRANITHNGVIRAFLFWDDSADVDLSAVFLDRHFRQIGSVSYSNLYMDGVGHSGDITNGSGGAAEYIDIDVNKISSSNRYVAIAVNLYRGGKFSDFECFAGVMGRDSLKSGELFEPRSVAIKFGIESEQSQIITVIIDLETNEVINADTGIGSSYGYNSSYRDHSSIVKSLIDLPKKKVTVMDALSLLVEGRGQLVDNPDDADLVFDAKTNLDDVLSICDF